MKSQNQQLYLLKVNILYSCMYLNTVIKVGMVLAERKLF